MNRPEDKANATFLSTYESPWANKGQYRLFFRAYMRGLHNTLLVGLWFAWAGVGDTCYVSVCGTDYCGPYQRGEIIPEWDKVSTNEMSSETDLVVAATTAMQKLSEYLEKV